jgi:hypothetical protein
MDVDTNKDKIGSQPVEIEEKEEDYIKINDEIVYAACRVMTFINDNRSSQQG